MLDRRNHFAYHIFTFLSIIGAVFSVISSLEMLTIFIGNFIFNTVYAKFNKADNTQWFWAVPSALFAIPITLTM